MSDNVIRFGGSHIGNQIALQNLKAWLAGSTSRNYVVVSAIPGLLDLIQFNLEQVFQNELNKEKLLNEIYGFYVNNIDEQPSDTYSKLADQLIGLLKGIGLIGDYSRALKDQVYCFAEKLSLEILSSLWKEATVIQPEDIALQVSSDFGNATFLSVDKNKLNKLEDGVFLVPGTYGLAENNKLARTGKTAADYTAAFLTKELGLDALKLWGLDNDFQRAKPVIIENPEIIKRLTYSEASELAYFEHYSFHPRTVEPLEHAHIPIQVLSPKTAKGEVETIINTETYIEKQIVKSVACTDDISLLKLDGPGVGLKPGILAKVTNQLNDAGLNIKSVITSQTSINFILSKENGAKALKLVHKLGFSTVTDIKVVNDLALIGIVGHGMQQAYGVSAKIFAAVANNKINVILSGSGASDLVSYLVVQESDKEKSVREIYNAFFSDK
ncbi:aspartate kinase [Draconibacterium halophilum]|uniref:aspartate kinase n=1 Tax=Draconibacterium halophilum TaxID=2706887 RepID=A0A6C0RCF0_9BACT|nr:aspartate kinase [Draconibacterium halophilum]QIA08328.1 aspartate kinase [Draconibacterium halophilum]